jgi:hypothetical protein
LGADFSPFSRNLEFLNKIVIKKILIISPHYPPSNLAAVHRSRLFAQHLPSFGWEPIILCVHEDYYEEKLDWNLYQLLPESQRIEKVKAFAVTKPRLIGDIGLRAFYQLRKKALQLVKNESIDFVYIPIPSFYVSMIGPYLHRKTGVNYGIDYIDPWVHAFPGSDKKFSRHWLSTQLAKYLEPKAVKHASLITGVAEGYYQGVIERNPVLKSTCLFGAMPYGGEKLDHEYVMKKNQASYLFQKNPNVLQLVYAGAFLPKALEPLRQFFAAIAASKEQYQDVLFHFIGTGFSANDSESYRIKPVAEEFGIWNTIIKEYPARIPYLDVLMHLDAADGIFILGSTEAHYTPSKVYQAVLSSKPVLAVLHKESSAANVLERTKAGLVLRFNGEPELDKIRFEFNQLFNEFRSFCELFVPEQVRLSEFDQYSARNVTARLVELLSNALKRV